MGEARRRGTAMERQKAAIKRNKQALAELLGGKDEKADADLRSGIAPFMERMGIERWRQRREGILSALNGRYDGDELAKAQPIRVQEDEMGWYLFLCEQALEDPMCNDVSQVARAAPFIAGIGGRWQYAQRVRGLDRKIGELLGKSKSKPDGLLFEMLVALAYAEHGWDVELIEESPPHKTPDMVVRRDGLEFYIECKRQERRASYAEAERDEFLRVWDAAKLDLLKNNQWLWFKGVFHVEAKALPDDFLKNIFAGKLPLGPGETLIYDGPEATIHARHINQVAVRAHLARNYVKVNTPTLSQLLGGDWAPLNSAVTIAHFIRPAYVAECECKSLGTYVEDLTWACGFTREFDSDVSLDKKARDVKNLLVDAVRQVPDDKPSIIHIAAETLEGKDVERKRTEKVFETISTFDAGKPVVGIRFHRFQGNQTLDKLWEFDETVNKFPLLGPPLDMIIPTTVVVPGSTELKSGSHWEIYP